MKCVYAYILFCTFTHAVYCDLNGVNSLQMVLLQCVMADGTGAEVSDVVQTD